MNSLLSQRFFRLIMLLSILIVALYIFYFSWKYLYPFIIALMLAWILQPFISLLQHRFRIPRPLAVVLLLGFFFTFLSSLILLVIVEAVKGIKIMAVDTPAKVEQMVTHVLTQVKSVFFKFSGGMEEWINSLPISDHLSLQESWTVLESKIRELASTVIESVLGILTIVLTSIPTSLTSFLAFALAAFFFSNDWDKMENALSKVVPEFWRERASLIPKQMKQTVKGVIKAQIILVCVSSVLIFTGLKLFQLEHATSITLIAAFVDLIPYIGTGVIFVPWAVYAFFQGDFLVTIQLSSLYMIVMITRQLLEPKLLASHFGIHPVLLLMALFLGFQLLGVYGMLLSPFILVCIKTLHTTGMLHLALDFIMIRK
ncbi:sporulation integral membrane protein YtvI [Halobacillus litoralis]|uniref:sporulation integral membrane protein YtvI n=1 Tax=Halobacillus litoralis TaxID=45668 RepID=UPI001CD1D0A8|nr:sporulation integral membrane protein YtvI [Halobacillus litoralis]MCA0969835.1 sporulation integral membrane protein YtvI [Halobacillus litoralis]